MEDCLKVGKRCNNNCVICSDLRIKSENEKTLQEIKEQIDNSESDEIILPCNSEIREDFFEILKYIKSQNKKVTLETNGRMFYYRNFCLKSEGLIDKFRIFYYSINAKSHDSKTKVDNSFLQTQEGEENIIEIFKNAEVETFFWSDDDNKFFFSKPTEVVIELTPGCNFDCNDCFNKASFAKNDRTIKEMSTEYVKQIIDSIAQAGIPRIRFSGGEPLLREDLFELMDYAKSKDLIIWLNTNGTLINAENVKILEKYVENVLIPFNGYDEESDYRWTKTRNSFKDKLGGIQILKNSRISIVRAGTVATNHNIENLEKIYEFVKNKELDYWEIWRPIPLHKNSDQIDISKLLSKLIKFNQDFGKPISIANSIPFCCEDLNKMDLFCLGARYDDGHSRIIVDPAGFAKPSYFIHKNIGDPREIMDCWNHDFMKKMRDLEFVPEECNNCLYVKKCKGGSRYIANLNNDNYKAKDPLMKKELNDSKMKILTPIDDFKEAVPLAKSGATEFYCGVKMELNVSSQRAGNRKSQLESLEDLSLLRDETKKMKIPLFLVLNKKSFNDSEFKMIKENISNLEKINLDGMIVANISLLNLLKESRSNLVVSSLFNCVNNESVKFFKKFGVKRIIFDRQITLQDLEKMTTMNPDIEYEAFAFNSNCRNINAFCDNYIIAKNKHCGRHTCNLPYVVFQEKKDNTQNLSSRISTRKISKRLTMPDFSCGACALYYFNKHKISSVKIVGRGLPTESKIQSVRFINEAMNLLNLRSNVNEYQSKVKNLFFRTFGLKCKKEFCYYPHFFNNE